MANEKQSCGVNSREDQHNQQDIEIKETLKQITNKILVMSGKG
ncbi:MAG: ATP-binding protein, partial [Deltaproteobacteria bacterium]|nr:ATP-binding protein [Deltaproteobacteria bacterium]